jgi:hypothetical protein
VAVKTGRPPLARDDVSVPVHVKLPSRQYDEFDRRARAARVSVPEILRRDLKRARPTDDDESED